MQAVPSISERNRCQAEIDAIVRALHVIADAPGYTASRTGPGGGQYLNMQVTPGPKVFRFGQNLKRMHTNVELFEHINETLGPDHQVRVRSLKTQPVHIAATGQTVTVEAGAELFVAAGVLCQLPEGMVEPVWG